MLDLLVVMDLELGEVLRAGDGGVGWVLARGASERLAVLALKGSGVGRVRISSANSFTCVVAAHDVSRLRARIFPLDMPEVPRVKV